MSGKRNASDNLHPRFPVLFDGWPLVYAPASPAALHLYELLNLLPDTVEAWVALPLSRIEDSASSLLGDFTLLMDDQDREELPRSSQNPAVGRVIIPVFSEHPDTPAGRLRWEQHTLSRKASESHARLIHTTTLRPPLFAPCPVVVSPAEAFGASRPAASRAGITERALSALGRGGLNAASALLWPEDLPAAGSLPFFTVPVFAPAAYSVPQPVSSDLPENYVLAPGPLTGAEMDLLAAAWSWALGGLGEEWKIVVSGLERAEHAYLRECFRAGQFEDSLLLVEPTASTSLSALFQHAGCVLLAGTYPPWGSAELAALACGCPIAAQATAQAAARISPAGFLTPPGDARALGAAVLSLIVDEVVSKSLRGAARQRASAWNRTAFQAGLARCYAELSPQYAGLLSAGQ